MTARVVVLTEDPAGPSARHRWGYMAEHLGPEGVEISLHAVEPREVRPAAFAAAAQADAVVIHRKLFRLGDFLRILRARRGRLAYDLDDAVMYRPPGRKRQRSFLRRLRFARTVARSSLYLAGNRYLLDQAPMRVAGRIQPTPIDLDRYAPKEARPPRGRVAGWIGTASTAPYLSIVGPALAELARARPDFVFRVIGPEPPPLPGVPVEHVPWTEAGEADAIRGLDAGILPLTDDPWSRGKCAFKALQYMACAVPVVASPVGMNVEVVSDGETGYLARTTDDWVRFLGRILGGPTLSEELGRAGRERVRRRYSSRTLAPPLAAALKALARRPADP